MVNAAKLQNQGAIIFLLKAINKNKYSISKNIINAKELFNMLNETNQKRFVESCLDDNLLALLESNDVNCVGDINYEQDNLIDEKFNISFLDESDDEYITRMFEEEKLNLYYSYFN